MADRLKGNEDRDESKRDKERIERAELARDPLWALPEDGLSKYWGEERTFGEEDG